MSPPAGGGQDLLLAFTAASETVSKPHCGLSLPSWQWVGPHRHPSPARLPGETPSYCGATSLESVITCGTFSGPSHPHLPQGRRRPLARVRFPNFTKGNSQKSSLAPEKKGEHMCCHLYPQKNQDESKDWRSVWPGCVLWDSTGSPLREVLTSTRWSVCLVRAEFDFLFQIFNF